MKTITKIRILRRLGLFNLAREIFYKITQGNAKWLRFYGQFIAKDNLCFDVGANIGHKTDLFLKLGARVVAIDPQEECVRYLQRKYRTNPRVTVIPKALAQQAGEREFFISEVNALSTISKDWIAAQTKSGRFGEALWEKNVVVKTTTLSDLIREYGRPQFCKIDVEGGELDVILGLKQPIPVISVEITRESLPVIEECIAHLNTLGKTSFNYCGWDSTEFTFSQWLSPVTIFRELYSLPAEKVTGDLYVRSC